MENDKRKCQLIIMEEIVRSEYNLLLGTCIYYLAEQFSFAVKLTYLSILRDGRWICFHYLKFESPTIVMF